MDNKEKVTELIRKRIKDTEELAAKFHLEMMKDLEGSEEYIQHYGMYKFYKGELRGLRNSFVFIQCLTASDVMEDSEVLK